jgi:hypothetical protein
MSRLYVTSSRTRAQRADDACSELRPSGSYEGGGCFARSYRKPTSDEDSFLRLGPDRFLAIAGTAIVDGGLGEEKKEEIFELFLDGGVDRVRSQILGHYAIAVKRDDEITLFTDPLGSFALYYTRGDDSWFVSNSLHACAASCDQVSLDATRLAVTILQSGLPADRTFYRGIRRLFGSQVIRINTAEDGLRVDDHAPLSYALPKQPASVSEAVERYGERVRSVFRRIAEIEDIGVLLTGGLDSRTVLAGVLDQGKAPTILSGTGNNSTELVDRDHKIARKIAGRLGLDFQEMDWSDRQPHSRGELERSFKKYGFKHEVYGSPESMVGDLKGETRHPPRLLLGGYSPAFTDIKPWETDKEILGLEDLIDHYLNKEACEDCIRTREAYGRVVRGDVLRRVAERRGRLGEKGDAVEEFVRSRLDLRINRDARFANFVNAFTHYVDPFRIKALYEPLKKMSAKVRSGNSLQIGIIRELKSELTNVEVLSRWVRKEVRNGKLEKKEVGAEPRNRIKKEYIKEKVKNISDRYAPDAVVEAMEAARKAASVAWPQIHKDHAMRRAYTRRLAESGVVQESFRDVSALSLKALARLEYFAAGIKSVADTSGESTSDS